MTRRQKRAWILVCVFGFGAFFIWMGFDGWTINALPAHYLGYIVMAVGIAALLGVNIWRGGPLDPRDDLQHGETDNTATHLEAK